MVGVFNTLLGLLFKRQRRGVNTVALSGRRRTIVEHVPEMRVAARAGDLDSAHAVALVRVGFERVLRHRRPEARPPGAGFEFMVGLEQGSPATHAPIEPLALVLIKAAAERPLRAALPGYVVLLRRQLSFPLVIRLLNFLRHGSPSLDYFHAPIRFFALAGC